MSTCGAPRLAFGSPNWISTPLLNLTTPFPRWTGRVPAAGSSEGESRGPRALGGATGDEVAPGAQMPGLLNRLPLVCELSLEGPGFDGVAERQLL